MPELAIWGQSLLAASRQAMLVGQDSGLYIHRIDELFRWALEAET
jgi:hypothetical protein